ncbi:hypothetical protein [Amphritea pacifica]|uniref:DUF4252 domain-containing protein n=1 Tax=Amphritea pacifica TaxID=2811233 RepID=A0ABS2W2H6_9GAMM|nr:hypothetical protein [Amphritea pacifica]MBN0985811.1 hypothetical protein [Amphritea pacifica]MBN1005892.1 hypothetical protein [Amphritea pacifica]
MKKLFFCFLLFAISSTSYAENKPVDSINPNIELVFSPNFRLDLPVEFFNFTKIASADDILIKFQNGSYLSFKAIDRVDEGLDPLFDLRLYPEFILGLRKPDSSSNETNSQFIKSLNAYKHRLGNFQVTIDEFNNKVVYLAKGDQESVAFAINKHNVEQILVINFTNIDDKKIYTTLKGLR